MFQLPSAGGGGAVDAAAPTPADAAVHIAVQGWEGDGADSTAAAVAAGYVMTPSDGASSVSPQSSADGEQGGRYGRRSKQLGVQHSQELGQGEGFV